MNFFNAFFLFQLAINRNQLIHTSCVRNIDRNWRKKMKLPEVSNAYGPLTDSADYSYLDNRPTPYGIKQKLRMEKNREIAKKIILLTKEVDFAVDRYNQMQNEQERRRQTIINSKLKPKSDLVSP